MFIKNTEKHGCRHFGGFEHDYSKCKKYSSYKCNNAYNKKGHFGKVNTQNNKNDNSIRNIRDENEDERFSLHTILTKI